MFQLSVHSLALSIQQGKKTKDFSPEKKKKQQQLVIMKQAGNKILGISVSRFKSICNDWTQSTCVLVKVATLLESTRNLN